jgi:membrane-associated protease RseP (regulator of RpoE activity)
MEHKDRIVTVAIITGVVALLLGCCLGAMAGAMGGYFIGHQASSRWNERIAPEPFEMPMLPDLAGMQGALVQEVVAGSPAEAAGVQVGDIITAVDGTPIDANHRLADVVSQYQPGDRVKIKVWRAGDAKSVTATLGENPQDSTRPYLGVRYADFAERPDDAEPND